MSRTAAWTHEQQRRAIAKLLLCARRSSAPPPESRFPPDKGRDAGCVGWLRDTDVDVGAAKERPGNEGDVLVSTRTIAIVALIIAVIVLLLLLL